MYRCTECGAGGLDVKPTFSPYGIGVCRCGSKSFKEGVYTPPPPPEPPPPSPWLYTLTDAELDEVLKHTNSIKSYNDNKGYPDNWPIGKETDFELKFRGFAAEKAASVMTGLPWRRTMFGSGFKERKACDIGERTEVRNVRKEDGRLAYKTKDTPRLVYLLAVGMPPTFRLAGWLEGREMARMPMDYNVPFPARFAKQTRLNPMPLPEGA